MFFQFSSLRITWDMFVFVGKTHIYDLCLCLCSTEAVQDDLWFSCDALSQHNFWTPSAAKNDVTTKENKTLATFQVDQKKTHPSMISIAQTFLCVTEESEVNGLGGGVVAPSVVRIVCITYGKGMLLGEEYLLLEPNFLGDEDIRIRNTSVVPTLKPFLKDRKTAIDCLPVANRWALQNVLRWLWDELIWACQILLGNLPVVLCCLNLWMCKQMEQLFMVLKCSKYHWYGWWVEQRSRAVSVSLSLSRCHCWGTQSSLAVQRY